MSPPGSNSPTNPRETGFQGLTEGPQTALDITVENALIWGLPSKVDRKKAGYYVATGRAELAGINVIRLIPSHDDNIEHRQIRTNARDKECRPYDDAVRGPGVPFNRYDCVMTGHHERELAQTSKFSDRKGRHRITPNLNGKPRLAKARGGHIGGLPDAPRRSEPAKR